MGVEGGLGEGMTRGESGKGALETIDQQDFSKQFPRLSCLPEPPILSEKGPGCLANTAKTFLAPPTARSKSERVS